MWSCLRSWRVCMCHPWHSAWMKWHKDRKVILAVELQVCKRYPTDNRSFNLAHTEGCLTFHTAFERWGLSLRCPRFCLEKVKAKLVERVLEKKIALFCPTNELVVQVKYTNVCISGMFLVLCLILALQLENRVILLLNVVFPVQLNRHTHIFLSHPGLGFLKPCVRLFPKAIHREQSRGLHKLHTWDLSYRLWFIKLYEHFCAKWMPQGSLPAPSVN